MNKAQFELEIKKMVSQCIPIGGNGTFIRQLIFHKETVINWDATAQLIKNLFPELKKIVQGLEYRQEKYELDLLVAKRRLILPRKTMSEVYANLDKYRKVSSEDKNQIYSEKRNDNWKVGDEGVDVTIPDANPFIVIDDKPSKNI